MTQEDKQLLIQELSARLPYGVFVHTWYDKPLDIRYTGINLFTNTIRLDLPEDDDAWVYINNAKPYLRSLSSMTEEEKEECDDLIYLVRFGTNPIRASKRLLDFYNKHYLDYNDLVPNGLAFEAPKDKEMYKIK